MGRHYVTWTTEVEVDVDLEEVMSDLTDDELADFGLMRVPAGVTPPSPPGDHDLCSPGLAEHLLAVRWARGREEA